MVYSEGKQRSGSKGKDCWLEKGMRKPFGVMKVSYIFTEVVVTFVIKLKICASYCM